METVLKLTVYAGDMYEDQLHDQLYPLREDAIADAFARVADYYRENVLMIRDDYVRFLDFMAELPLRMAQDPDGSVTAPAGVTVHWQETTDPDE